MNSTPDSPDKDLLLLPTTRVQSTPALTALTGPEYSHQIRHGFA